MLCGEQTTKLKDGSRAEATARSQATGVDVNLDMAGQWKKKYAVCALVSQGNSCERGGENLIGSGKAEALQMFKTLAMVKKGRG